jgi:hypothetical protein
MDWHFHLYDRETATVWGWGRVDGQIWEYFGKWRPDGDKLSLKWFCHRNETAALKNMQRTQEISIHQKSTAEMNRHIPNFEGRLLSSFIFEKMKDSDELVEPA